MGTSGPCRSGSASAALMAEEVLPPWLLCASSMMMAKVLTFASFSISLRMNGNFWTVQIGIGERRAHGGGGLATLAAVRLVNDDGESLDLRLFLNLTEDEWELLDRADRDRRAPRSWRRRSCHPGCCAPRQ